MTTRRIAAVSVGLAVMTLALAGSPAGAQSVEDPVDMGELTIVTETREEISGGGSETLFGFALPEGASCPGDSRNDQWRVQTFIVPADVDPATLTYTITGPEGEGLYAMFGLDTNAVVDVLTAPNEAPGNPGLIVGLRAMTLASFLPGTFPDGTYRVGVACTYFRDTASYWDTEIRIRRDPEDRPGEISWEPATAAAPESGGTDQSDGGSGSLVLIVVALAGTAGAALYFSNRSRRTSNSLRRSEAHPQEMS